MSIVFSKSLSQGRFETHLAPYPGNTWQATQVHGNFISSVQTLPCEADGLYCSWDQFNNPLVIKTADCLPIVIEGKDGVAFIHAGWRGLASGILNKPEIDLISPTLAFIGPSIQSCCFKVSEDFRSHFKESSFFFYKEDDLFFNLQKEAKETLLLKFPQLEISISNECTCCNQKYFSHRRNKTSERNWNIYFKGI
jgi:YfiH family protein